MARQRECRYQLPVFGYVRFHGRMHFAASQAYFQCCPPLIEDGLTCAVEAEVRQSVWVAVGPGIANRPDRVPIELIKTVKQFVHGMPCFSIWLAINIRPAWIDVGPDQQSKPLH